MLERIGHDYSFPFGDRSVIPTNLLVRAAVGSLEANSVVIEGTGADGAFGPWAAHSRVAALPRLARRALAGSHAWLRLWQQASEAERVSGLARGSLQMPVAHAFVAAQNVLDGIAYTIPGPTRESLEKALHEYVEVHSLGLEAEQRLSLLDLVHVCAGIFAAKTFDPLRAAGLRPVYPFLEPAMVRLSAALPYAAKSAERQGKIVLKRLLGRQLPRELIERPKSGFIPPMAAILTDPAIQAYSRAAVLSAQNPLRPFFHARVVGQLLDRAAAGQPLSKGSYKFLWALIFASCWLRQVEC
jgi:asparagine synthase (glutamine-hydrolysing)